MNRSLTVRQTGWAHDKPREPIGRKIKICKILGYSGYYRSSVLSRTRKFRRKSGELIFLFLPPSLSQYPSLGISLSISPSLLLSLLSFSSYRVLACPSQMYRQKTWGNDESLYQSASTWKIAHLANIDLIQVKQYATLNRFR